MEQCLVISYTTLKVGIATHYSQTLTNIHLIFFLSTDATLNAFEKDWVVYLMASLTGSDASFLSATTDVDQSLPPSSPTKAYQDSPRSRVLLASNQPVSTSSPSPSTLPSTSLASQATSSSPRVLFSVPAGPYVELSPTSASNLAAFQHPDGEQNPVAASGCGDGSTLVLS